MPTDLLRSNWNRVLSDLLRSAADEVLVCSPFVTRRGVDLLVDHLPSSVRDAGAVRMLVNLSPQNVIQGSTDPASLHHLCEAIDGAAIHHLPRLHAKAYVADRRRAIITPGNLTAGGLNHNIEYGIHTDDADHATTIRRDLEEFAGLGAQLTIEEIQAYVRAVSNAHSAFQEQQASAQRSLHDAFETALQEANDVLLRSRVKGESINATFAKTIRYVLRTHGPMATRDLHPHVQQVHPDLCDDAVDRVIDGQHYGKRWKHRVRAAQSTLKRRGAIERVDGQWRLCSE